MVLAQQHPQSTPWPAPADSAVSQGPISPSYALPQAGSSSGAMYGALPNAVPTSQGHLVGVVAHQPGYMVSHAQAGPAAQPRPKRRRITPEQLDVLTKVFAEQDTPGYELREKLSLQLNMTVREVQVWFQNRRAKVNRERVQSQQQQQIDAQRKQLEEQARSLQGSRDGLTSSEDVRPLTAGSSRGDRSRPQSANRPLTGGSTAGAQPSPGLVQQRSLGMTPYHFSPSQAQLAYGPGGAQYAYAPPYQQPYYMPLLPTNALPPASLLRRSLSPGSSFQPAPARYSVAHPDPPSLPLPAPSLRRVTSPLDDESGLTALANAAGSAAPQHSLPSMASNGLTLPPLRSLAFGLPSAPPASNSLPRLAMPPSLPPLDLSKRPPLGRLPSMATTEPSAS